MRVVDIGERAAVVSGLGSEQPRYYLQHALGFQVHDLRHPHHVHRHGRADIGWKDALMAGWTSLSYAVADVEGNGQQPPDLVELAVLPITSGTIGEPVTWLVKPPRPIKYFATRVHGISGKDVASAPAFADVKHEVRQALSGKVLVAHNAHVDMGILGRELGEWECPEVFDTLKLARRLLPGRPTYKLGALVKALSLDDGIPSGLVPHRAAYDVLVTARLFVRLATRNDGTQFLLEELRGQEADRNPGGTDETASLF